MIKGSLSLYLLLCFSSLFLLSSFIFLKKIPYQDRWVAPAAADAVKNPFPHEPLAVKQGEELYNVYCWSCHGETGYGDGAAGGALGVKPANFHEEQVKKQSDGALFWKLSEGRGNMPPFKESLSEEQRWQLVTYLRKLGNQK